MFGNLIGLGLYKVIGVALVVGILAIGLKIQTTRLEHIRTEFATFKAEVIANGKQQEIKTKETNAYHLKIKKEMDNENKRLRANLALASKRLSDARAGSSYLPKPADPAGSADVALDRAKLETAIRDFDAAMARLLDEGDKAIVDLNTAKDWVHSLGR